MGKKERLLIYGDYDVDGTTAVALVYKFIQQFYSNIDYYIPDRYNEGYGVSTKGVDYAAETGVGLIIVLDCGIKAVEEITYAKEKGIEYKDMAELVVHPKIQSLFRARIDTLQQLFAHYEQIKRFTLLPEPFSMERGELTNTLKLRRPAIAQNYKDLIDKMYEE